MTIKQKTQGAPWLYDETTGDIVGVKDPDSSELLFQRILDVGSFYDTTDQTDGANTATAMQCNTVDITRGITVVDGSKFRVRRAGVYNVAFSAQLINTDSADWEVSVWARKNGVDVADSCTDITVPSKHGSDNGAAVAAWNFFFTLAANDYVQLMWSTPNTAVSIQYTAARTSPVRPAVPSVIVTMNEVNPAYP